MLLSADALEIESTTHLVPVIFPIRVGTHAHDNEENIIKLHARTNIMKIMFYCRWNLLLIATRILVRLGNILVIDKL